MITTSDSQARTKGQASHTPHDKFFINFHALHNGWRLREVLPRNLTEPVQYVADREAFHQEMAKGLRKKNPKKRARAREKARDTREQKKQAAKPMEDTEDEAGEAGEANE
jgi:hypothetical protein